VTQAGPDSRFSDDWTSWHGGGPGGIWQSGHGLASDGNGIFFAVVCVVFLHERVIHLTGWNRAKVAQISTINRSAAMQAYPS